MQFYALKSKRIPSINISFSTLIVTLLEMCLKSRMLKVICVSMR